MNRYWRDLLFFEVARWVGLGGVLYEAVVTHGERPYLILLYGSMMGFNKVPWSRIGTPISSVITAAEELGERVLHALPRKSENGNDPPSE